MAKYIVEFRTGETVVVEAEFVRSVQCNAGRVVTFYVGDDIVAKFDDFTRYELYDNLLP